MIPGRDPVVVENREALERALGAMRGGGGRVAFVPTMGFLHQGHRALLERGRAVGDHLVLSIFVNPLQFGPGEDLDRYPRDLERDLEVARAAGVDLVFSPPVEVMYPGGEPQVTVDPGPGAAVLCGAFRPGHFRGVLTVVARLFGLIRPQVAVFGRKDAQQAALVRQMVRDLEMGVEVEVAPVVREADGLALSSRNAYLSPGERAVAPALFQGLEAADRAFRQGERDSRVLAERVEAALAGKEGFRLEYAQVVDGERLEAPEKAREGDLLAAAAWLGRTRLIDNLVLGAEGMDPRLPGGGA